MFRPEDFAELTARPRQIGRGTFSSWRVHPSSARRGISSPMQDSSALISDSSRTLMPSRGGEYCFTLLLSRRQTLVHGFDEFIGTPQPGLRVKARIVIFGISGSFDLIQRHTFLDRRLNAIADDHHHVAVLERIEFIADAAMTRNDVRSPFFFMFGNGNFQNSIQSVDRALDSAPFVDVDPGVAVQVENVAGYDHVRVAEEHQAIAVGRGVG